MKGTRIKQQRTQPMMRHRRGCCVVLLILSSALAGCSTSGLVEQPRGSFALRVGSGRRVTMAPDMPAVVLSVEKGAGDPDIMLPLTWGAADRDLGRIVAFSGLTAVYRRSSRVGENRVTVRDQAGNQGRVLIVQRGSDGKVEAESLHESEEDTPPQTGDHLEPSPPESIDNPAGDDVRSGYTLLIGDEIAIEVFREPDLSGTFRIEQGGTIRHALFGTVQVAGLTVAQAEDAITQMLAKRFLVHPKVTVRIVSSQASQILVMGEVKKPGALQIPFGESMTLLEVIAEAGGFTELASVNRVRVIREEDGGQKRIRARVGRIVSGADPDIEILPDDVIMVPQTFF